MPLYTEQDKVPTTRLKFRKLLAVNPNYFGNLSKSEFEPIEIIKNNVSYEALTCVGFNPVSTQLEATIAVNLPLGYDGSLCTPGSLEYVRFYINYGGEGSTFTNLGYAAAPVHDIPNANDCAKETEKPLYYTVTLPFTAIQSICIFANLPTVRAILSWNLIPPANDPSWIPVWGNVVDQNIQITPRPFKIIDFLELMPKDTVSKLPPQFVENPDVSIPLPDPSPTSFTSLAKLYGDSVPAHRFGLPSLQSALSVSLSQQDLVAAHSTWSKLKLNFDNALNALATTSGNTTFEQLYCLGLDYGRGSLVATFEVKLSSGYGGTLCTAGSDEYVAFWADWNNTCTWSYLGTVPVNVHDISSIPKDGLTYSAVMPIDLIALAQYCTQPKIARVRAVLSWGIPWSTIDANSVPYFGNIVDSHVQIPPGAPLVGFTILSIGGIVFDKIDTTNTGITLPGAYFVYEQTPADSRGCPFNGQIVITGDAPSTPEFINYRLWTQLPAPPGGGTSISPSWVANSIDVFNSGKKSTVTPSPDGWFPFMLYQDNNFYTLANWTPPVAGLWQIGFEFENSSGVASAQPSTWYNILVKTSSPVCTITSDKSCDQVTVGTPITGEYSVSDPYLGGYGFGLAPNLTNNSVAYVQNASSTDTNVAGTWELDTGSPKMEPCGYSITLSASDRTIINSVPGSGNLSSKSTGVCLLPSNSNTMEDHVGWDRCEMVE